MQYVAKASTYWHVGISDPAKLHISLHLTCHVHARPKLTAIDMLRTLDEGDSNEDKWADFYPFVYDDIGRLNIVAPAQIRATVSELAAEINRGILEREILLNWLSRVTAHGFNIIPWSDSTMTSISESDATGSKLLLSAQVYLNVLW